MAVFSVLRPSLQRNMRAATLIFVRSSPFLKVKNTQKAVSRNVGMLDVNRKMLVMPAKYIYNVLYDQFIFFTLLGVIPVVLTVFCANIFVGPAELKDIPEGYEPKEYEYYKGPIQRFLAKYFHTSYQETYEKSLHVVYHEQDKAEFRELERKVKKLQDKRNDYKGWYFIPGDLQRMEA